MHPSPTQLKGFKGAGEGGTPAVHGLMAPRGLFVVGLIEASGRVHNDTEEDLDVVAETTLRRVQVNEKGLRALDLSNTLFTTRFLTEFADCLSHNTELVELYMDNCRIGDDGVRLLASGLVANKSCSLKALSLENNQIHCRGVGFIAKIIDARAARWSRTFGGYKAPSMGPGHSLQYLSLKGNEIAAIGAKSLAEVLMRCDDSLETLSLEGNNICDWGAGWLAMALRNHGMLQCLNLRGNPIGVDGIEELKGACATAKATLAVGSGAGLTASLPELVADQQQATVYVSEVLPPSRPCSAARSRPSSAARSRPSSAAQSRPSSAARSRPSSAHSSGSAMSVGYRRPGSASRRVPITMRRRPTSAAAERGGTVGHDGTTVVSEAQQQPAAQEDEEVLDAPEDTADEGNELISGEATLKRPSSANRISAAPSPARQRLDASMKQFLKNGKPNPHWPPHPLRIAKTRGPAAAAVPAPPVLTFVAPTTSSAAAASQRLRPSERGVGSDEAESTTVLSSPSRWRWKRRDNGPENGGGASECSVSWGPSGCGAAAVRSMRRSCSAPGLTRRYGALMGPAAAMAMAH
eukprot:gb/GFBE01018633.1/.p1 GENE.gb/GFBE01018633.1/~~gb/GFBE01018633.1/.p1  ORF type:complete len:579 (+),score=86.66 gb/GFBE01018633.1/:1-1737(+)